MNWLISQAIILSICTTSYAFTAIRSQSNPSLVSPLRVSKTPEATTIIPDLSSSTKPVDESSIFADSEDIVDDTNDSSWQKNLDMLLAPDTSAAERQIVLSDLLSSGDEIQESVRTALKERKVRHHMTHIQCLLYVYIVTDTRYVRMYYLQCMHAC